MQRLLPCFASQDVLYQSDVPVESTPSELTSPVQAWENRKLTIGFSGGGFLLPYHLGVYQSLALMGIADPSMPMAGASAGSLVVSSIKCGLTLQQQMDSFLEAAHECRENGVAGRLRKVLKAQLNKHLPPDAAARCSDGTCWLSVTQVLPRPANKLYGGFASRQQLIKALLASCHLPRVSDGGLFTSYKSIHKRCFDGGFSNLVPVPPAPPPTASLTAITTATTTGSSAAAAAAASSSLYSGHSTAEEEEAHSSEAQQLPTAPAAALLRQDSTKAISTQLSSSRSSSSSKHSSVRRAGSSRMHIASSTRHQSSSSSGWAALAASCAVAGRGAYVASEGWFAVRVCVLPSKHLEQFPAMFRAPTADEVSIALDKFQAWPHNLDVTTKYALYPQAEDFLYDLFDRGAADAVSWARQQGFPEAVLQKAAAAAGCEGAEAGSSNGIPQELRVMRKQLDQREQQGSAGSAQQQAEDAAVAAAAAGASEAAEGVRAAAGM